MQAYGSPLSRKHGGAFDPNNSQGAFVTVTSQYQSPPLPGKHGGAFDPNNSQGAFATVTTQNQSYTGPPRHCGGGAFDPNNPTFANPSVSQQPRPQVSAVPIYQTPFNTGHQTFSHPQPVQQAETYQPSHQQPGVISQLCACFK
ncbi:hypothetical protein K491DRAFT_292623 [Lophiostoma macrostomum CBS 122681]|uniref:Uncharacterized protein n=1 Tax=Lophiostoma macrostomum CBS 122681 TaxID=1314788 RepID=A0A6A6SIH5_9PLEO|nr:hypothetical protein K491DRAFT_292623 [Lophiostoma macrostomum CBS 122681]